MLINLGIRVQALGDGEDMLTSMARELVTESGIGESADLVWRQIQREQRRVLPASDAPTEPEPVTSVVLPAEPASPPALSIAVAATALKFGSRPPSGRPLRRKEAPAKDQLALF